MEDIEIPQLSKYNSGVAIQIRLDGLWNKANYFFITNLYSKWNDVLDNIWRELARDIKEAEFTDKEKLFKKFDEDLAKLGKIQDKEPEGFVSPTEEQIKNRNEQRKILVNKEVFLKRLENKLGKGTALQDGHDDFE